VWWRILINKENFKFELTAMNLIDEAYIVFLGVTGYRMVYSRL
jgi:hypothetical protein